LKNSIGIDIGSKYIKMVLLSTNKKNSIVKTFLFETPYKSKDSEEIHPEEFVKHLTDSIPRSIFRNSILSVNVPASSVMALIVDLPDMVAKNFNTAAIFQAKAKMIPVPGPDSIFECAYLEKFIEQGKIRHRVLVLKTEKVSVHNITSLFAGLGEAKIEFITPSSFSIINAFPKKSKICENDSAFIDIGHEHTNIDIAQEGKLNFHRNIKYGIKDIISQISNLLNVSEIEAENIIQMQGVFEQSENADKSMQVAWNSVFDSIIQEIRRSANFYKKQSRGRRISHFFLLGGGTKIPELVSSFTAKIGGEWCVLDPFDEMDLDLNKKESVLEPDKNSFFSGALSLAITASPVMQKKDEFNFIGQKLEKKKKLIHQKIASGIAAMAFVVFILIAIFSSLVKNKSLQGQINRSSEDDVLSVKILSSINDLKEERNILKERFSKIKHLSSHRTNPAIILYNIFELVPEDILFEKFSITVPENNKSGNKDSSALTDEPAMGKSTFKKNIEKTIPQPKNNEMGDSLESNLTSKKGGAIEIKPEYIIALDLFCFKNYQKSIELIEECEKNLKASHLFSNIVLSYPEMETFHPKFLDEEEVELTPQKLRKFKIMMSIK